METTKPQSHTCSAPSDLEETYGNLEETDSSMETLSSPDGTIDLSEPSSETQVNDYGDLWDDIEPDIESYSEPLEITTEDMELAFLAQETDEDTPTYRHIRKVVRRFLKERYEYYPIITLADMLGAPVALVHAALSPDEMVKVNTRPSPLHVMTSPIITQKETNED